MTVIVFMPEKKLNLKLDNRPINMRQFWSRLWRLIAPSHKQIIYLLVLAMIYEIFKFVGPYLLKRIIDLIVNFKPEHIKDILIFIALILIFDLVVALLDYLADKETFKILAEAERYLSVNAQTKMVRLGLSYHEKENTGNKIFKIQRGISSVEDLLMDMSWQVVPTMVQIILTSTILFFVDWRFGLIFLLFVPIFAFLTARLNKKISPSRKLRHDKYEEASGKMAQSIININTVKSFVQEKREEREFKTIAGKIEKNALIEFFSMLNFNLGRNLVIDLGRITMLAFGIYLVSVGQITVGSLVFIATISEKALLSLFRISRLYDRVMDSSEAIERLYDLSKEECLINNPKDGLVPADVIGKIEFQNVNFRYSKKDQLALNNINVKINSDCVTALVGPSGGGKTTLARMIYRHYDPQSGRVLLDGKDLREYDLYKFRKFISIVPQDVEVFNTSVRENIAYAKPKASLQEVKAAARIANAEEFIEKLSDGYHTMVGERGIKLSGGQRQRIGIARAILANPRILIFDEATSNLDSYSEKLIQDAMEKIGKGRTMVIIAHRLSTIKKADKIIVLEKGKVAEEGSHFQLASKGGGLYAKLLSLQEMGEIKNN